MRCKVPRSRAAGAAFGAARIAIWPSRHTISDVLIIPGRNYMNHFGRKSTLDLSKMGCVFAVSGWPTWRKKAKAA